MEKIKILFICLGNICRSPLAQGIFEKKIKEQNIQNFFFVDSAGTSDEHAGEKPYYASIYEAEKSKIDITHQRSRKIYITEKDKFDYFIPMDQWNYRDITQNFLVDIKKVYKMRHFDTVEKDGDVPDPWNQEQKAFTDVFNMLDRCITEFVIFLRKKHQI